MALKVILQKDVKNIGKKGDVVDVAEGYGRNYLIPRGLAVEATSGNLRKIEHARKAEAKKAERELKDAQAVGAKIDGKTLEIEARVGDAGKLFGSITNQEIADHLRRTFSVEIDRRKIELKEPIKSLGSYPVQIKVHPQVHISFTVKVIGE